MKTLTSLLLTSAVLISASSLSATDTPAALPQPKIAVVDVQAILDKSTATQGVKAEIEKRRAEIQKEMSTYETELRGKDQELAKQQKTLPEKEFSQKRQDFEKRVAEVQMKLEVLKVQLEQAFDTARQDVYQAFLKSSDKVKQDVGANIVLYKEQVVLADPSYDVTEKVLATLNKDLPSVKVKFMATAEIEKQLKSQTK
ncbi:OmpH family outer membrane protein [Candidatus Bealeia paramacronuclearis]|uniref:OmpH family outer membrane protein n=1 Tax=Candidatus Bealeia paramacronuclearis TaxID=1921001 RepID=A0ABZ2C681_9PROT|nr:OmpH family outer membrane protein [Candidatus Bealeia paramacronuclearis]